MTRPRPSAPDPLASALLPVLLHRLGNATQLLTGMNAMLSLEGGDTLFAERTDELARCATTVDELGWALAVVGSGAGARLLLARRDPRGLEILLPLVAGAARRAGGARVVVPPGLPALTPATLDGWQLPWALASLVLAAACESSRQQLDWSVDPCETGGWRLTLQGADALASRAAEVLPRLPGAEWTLASGLGVLRLPATWLRAGASDETTGATG